MSSEHLYNSNTFIYKISQWVDTKIALGVDRQEVVDELKAIISGVRILKNETNLPLRREKQYASARKHYVPKTNVENTRAYKMFGKRWSELTPDEYREYCRVSTKRMRDRKKAEVK